MKEIICWGNIQIEFERLNLKPKCTYRGFSWDDASIIYVYQLDDAEYSTLENDPEENWDREDCKSCWRYASGSNMVQLLKRFTVRGKHMLAWDCNQDWGFRAYPHLLSYLVNQVGVSSQRNITACAVDLAKINGLTLGELFRKYQGDGMGEK